MKLPKTWYRITLCWTHYGHRFINGNKFQTRFLHGRYTGSSTADRFYRKIKTNFLRHWLQYLVLHIKLLKSLKELPKCSTLLLKFYLKNGTGYAWAGHSKVTLLLKWTSILRVLSPDVKRGLTEPTGSKRLCLENLNFIIGRIIERRNKY